MKKILFIIALISVLGLGINLALYNYLKCNISLIMAITFGTTAYHLVMRLAVGYVINIIFNNKINYKLKWFKVKNWEMKLYKKLKVKKWKRYIPTFAPETFELNKKTLENIIQVTCQSEIVHEIIMVLSFVPLFFTVWFGEFLVFFITSLISCLLDGIFVTLQRFNRPRLLKLINCHSNI